MVENMKTNSSHESPEPAHPIPAPVPGRAHIDDIVEAERSSIPNGSKSSRDVPNREAGERVNDLGGRCVGDIGVVHGQRVRITAIYRNGKFDYEFLARTR